MSATQARTTVGCLHCTPPGCERFFPGEAPAAARAERQRLGGNLLRSL